MLPRTEHADPGTNLGPTGGAHSDPHPCSFWRCSPPRRRVVAMATDQIARPPATRSEMCGKAAWSRRRRTDRARQGRRIRAAAKKRRQGADGDRTGATSVVLTGYGEGIAADRCSINVDVETTAATPRRAADARCIAWGAS